jgi:hypothetical protein
MTVPRKDIVRLKNQIPGEVLIAKPVRFNYKDTEHLFYSAKHNMCTIIKYHPTIGMYQVESEGSNGTVYKRLMSMSSILAERSKDTSWEFLGIV